MPAPHSAPSNRAHYDDAADASLDRQVEGARTRMLNAHVPTVMGAAVLLSLTLYGQLHGQVDTTRLHIWLALRLLIVLPRLAYGVLQRRHEGQHQGRWHMTHMALVIADGLLWGATWWALVPVDRLDLAAITLPAVIGVASMSAFILHADVRIMAAHVLPMMLPNALYCLLLNDVQGMYGLIGLSIFTVLLLLETRRAQSRLLELLRLRFAHERVLGEREEALALAQHHSEAKSRFLASMSHEMRTPLHGMLGLARLLSEDEVRPHHQRRLGLLERSGEHLLTVINDVLDVARVEAGHVHIDSQAFDLEALIDDVASISTVTANRRGLSLILHADLRSGYTVLGDAMRVRQILHNLLGNAIKFTERGHVVLRVEHQPGRELVTFFVEDTGIGIPAAERARIFEPFHQVDASALQRRGGTGLGLTIARELCLAMGGDLRCHSEEGRGTTFECSLSLPHCTEVQSPLISLATKAAAPISGSVLLVEDNAVNALVAEAVMRQIGVEVHVLDDGAKAVEWLATHEVDLVLMDCQMPVMDGLEATRQIRARERARALPPVPIVALTANVFPHERQRCMDAGMDDYLAKPFRREELQRVMASHIGRLQQAPAVNLEAARA